MKIISTFLGLLLAFNVLAQEEKALTQADQMPYFEGCLQMDDEEKRRCSNNKLVHFIANYLTYPQVAKDAQIEGTVYVSFIVNAQGVVTAPSILMGIGGGCEEAALAVIKEMPRWEPGIHNGKPVAVKLNLPIQFSLKNENNTSEDYNISWGQLRGNKITTADLIENLNSFVYVRDTNGKALTVEELTFVYQKKNKTIQASSRDGITNELRKVVYKVKKGGLFTIEVTLQEQGEFVKVKRAFQII